MDGSSAHRTLLHYSCAPSVLGVISWSSCVYRVISKLLQTRWKPLDLTELSAWPIGKRIEQNQCIRQKTDNLPLNYCPKPSDALARVRRRQPARVWPKPQLVAGFY
jgi:hypothetical protein